MVPQKLGPFFSLFLMRKPLSSGQKWFLRPYFPLIRSMFVLRSGLRFSFRALEVPESRVRKRPLSLTKMTFSLALGSGTSIARNENLRPLLNTNIPLISGKYGLRNHFWPLESRFLMSNSEKNAFFSKSFHGPILIFWNLILYTFLCTKIKKNYHGQYFFSWCMFRTHVIILYYVLW